MNHKRASKMRLWSSRILINIARKLPEVPIPAVRHLQAISRRLEKQSERAYHDSQPPVGTAIEFLSIRLIEIFPIEEFSKLEQGLERLFPEKRTDVAQLFNQISSTLFTHRYLNVGVLYRRTRGRLSSTESKQLASLPDQVESVRVWLHQILPSIIVMTFDVILNEVASETLTELQHQKYSAEIELRKYHSKGGFSFSALPSDSVMKREIANWFIQLRRNVERQLEPYFRGYFLTDGVGDAKLPAIEIFRIVGAPTNKADFSEGNRDADRWLYPLGFHLYGSSYFSDESWLFIPSERDVLNIYSTYAHRIIVRQTADGENDEEYKYQLLPEVFDLLYDLVDGLAILDFLNTLEGIIARLRHMTYQGAQQRRFLRLGRINRNFEHGDLLLHVSLILDQLLLEFEHDRDFIADRMRSVSNLESRRQTLDKFILGSIDYRVDMLRQHLRLITSWYDQFLTRQNMIAMHRLTIFALVLAILGLFGWANLLRLVNFLLEIMGSILSIFAILWR